MLQFYKLHPEAKEPVRAYTEAAGFDLHALLLTEKGNPSAMYILPGQSKAIPTGLVVRPPNGLHFVICSRSGLALHEPPIFVANAPGIVDPDYTGELKVILYNGGQNVYGVRHGERIAQLLVWRNCPLGWEELNELPEPDTLEQRGARGFGSTGR